MPLSPSHRPLVKMKTSPYGIATLPDELYEPILSNLPGADLKNLRLTSKKLSELSQAPLFEELTLLPFRSHLSGFQAFVSNSHLARTVRNITYDDRWIAVFDSLPTRNHLSDRQENQLAKVKIDSFYTNLNPKMEMGLLNAIFKCLSSLRSLKVLANDLSCWCSSNDEPVSLRRIFDLSTFYSSPAQSLYCKHQDSARRSASIVALAAAMRSQPAVSIFSGHCMIPENTSSPDTAPTLIFKGALKQEPIDVSQLQHLQISLNHYHELPLKHTRGFAEITINVIHTAVNLESLTLIFGHGVNYKHLKDQNGAYLMERFGQTGCFFPSLKTLNLQSLRCRVENLNNFLSHHALALESLQLSNMTLLPSSKDHSKPCLVKMLLRCRSLALEQFKMEGYFSNSGNQLLNLQSSDTGVMDDLKKDASSWVTRRTNRMPFLLKRIEIQEGQQDVLLPTKNDLEWRNDDIWKILPKPYRFFGDTDDEILGVHEWEEDFDRDSEEVESESEVEGDEWIL